MAARVIEVLVEVSIVVLIWALSLVFVSALEAGDTARGREAEECSWKVMRQWRDGAYTASQANKLLGRCGSNWSVK
jgi:hypothetical protein